MSTFILVHGSWHGAWCWDRVVPLLEARGHRAIAVDLPGHGADRTPAAALTFAAYVERVTDVIDAQPEPVVLVGHSMGGTMVTAAAEARAEKVATLIYVTAYLPADGQSLLDLARTDAASRILPNLVVDGGMHWVRDEALVEVFLHDCSTEDRAFAIPRLVHEPLSVVETPVRTTAARFGRIPRTYIEATADHAVGIDLQRRMHAATPCRVMALPTGHSPFFAAPAALADAIVTSA